MVKGSDKLARCRIPELSGFVQTRRQNPSAVWTKRRVVHTRLMGKCGDELAGGHIPELRGFVRARRQDPSAIRTEHCVVDLTLMGK